MEEISVATAFIGGVISFISPCILPIVPAYISFISGMSADELLKPEHSSRELNRVILNSLGFIVGFSAVFMALGASATAVGRFLMAELGVLSKIAGVVVVAFGLHVAGVLRIGYLDREKRFYISRRVPGMFGPLFVGMAFAFGWSPCIGPILGGILLYAGTRETVGQGVKLLGFYSLGLAIPFFLTGLSVGRFMGFLRSFRGHFRAVEVASGVFLVLIGIMIFFGSLNRIAYYIARYMPDVG